MRIFAFIFGLAMDALNEEIRKACEIMNSGGLILYPTDTIWGIGCDATNAEAVNKVYQIKKRADSKSLIILLDTTAKLDFYVSEFPEIALDLIEWSEKPLTIIYSGARNLAPNLIASDGSVGIRITRETFSQQLCRYFRKPLVSTSANISGQPSPGNFTEISPEILASVDYVVNFRREEKQQQTPSSIVKLEKNGQVQIIRE